MPRPHESALTDQDMERLAPLLYESMLTAPIHAFPFWRLEVEVPGVGRVMHIQPLYISEN